MQVRTWLALFTVAVFLNGCEQHLPPLSATGFPHYDESGAPTVKAVQNQIACELQDIVTSVPKGQEDSNSWAGSVAPKGLENVSPRLLYNLSKYNFVATINLTLEVTDSESANPSLSFITPFNRMKASGNSYTFGLGGQLSGTQDRKLTLNYPIDLAKLKALPSLCSPLSILEYSEKTIPKALGLESGLEDNLGLNDIVADGLRGLDQSSAYNIYSTSGPVVPSILRKIVLSTAASKPNPLGISSFDGAISFAPSTTPGLPLRTATLAGLVTFGDKAKCYASLTGNTVTADADPPTDIKFTLAGSLTSLLPATTPAGLTVEPACAPGQPVSGVGTIDGTYMTPPDSSTSPLTITLTYSGNSSVLTPAQPPAAAVTQSPSQNIGLHALLSQIPELSQVQSNFQPLSSLTAMSVTSSTGSSGGGGGTPGAGSGITSASTSGTSFGSTVDFTVIYGLNGGPTWSLTHFKGPAGTSSLLNLSRTAIDTLSITFVPACQDATNVPYIIKDYWDSIGPCIASSLVNAANVGQTVIYFQNLPQLTSP